MVSTRQGHPRPGERLKGVYLQEKENSIAQKHFAHQGCLLAYADHF
jgi:hypothetical protein